jgi:predicted Zn-dependent protease with MMP-like domain
VSPHDDEAVEALLDRAEEALDRGEIEQALDMLEDPAQGPDAHPEVRAMYGLALYYGGEYEEAHDWLVEAVNDDPDDVEARGALGVCHFFRLEVVTAEKELRRALLSERDWAEAHYWLGRVLEFRGRYPEAQLEFQRAAQLDPDQYKVPVRLSDDELDGLLHEAMDALPPSIRKALDEVAILVDEYPTEEMLQDGDPPFPPDLLGLSVGPNVADRMSPSIAPAASTIHLFRRNIEHYGGERADVVDELRVTLLHEIGHALGMDEDDLRALELE